MKNILLTVCGRAGSKGVRSKNIRDFHGIPLIMYTLAAAKLFIERNPQFSIDLCVNSDSEDLLSIAGGVEGVATLMRPVELAQDDSPKVPVIIHSLNTMESSRNKVYDIVLDLDITSPLRNTMDIERVLQVLDDNQSADVVFTVVNSRRNPYFNMVEIVNGTPRKILESKYVARQQAPEVFDMNASVYGYRRSSLGNLVKISPFDGVVDIVLMRDTAVIDIDSENDFELMELLAGHFFNTELKELKDRTIEMFKIGR